MFTLIDSGGLLLATLCYLLLLVLPGLAIARAANLLGFASATPGERLMLALLLAHGGLPAVNALLATLVGLDAAIWFTLILAAIGLAGLTNDDLPFLSRQQRVAVAAWLAFVVGVWVDIEWNGRLYQSLLAVDMIKHASITRSIADAGVAPPTDPFYARPGPATFYYFYFISAAMVERISGGLIDARAAVGGQVVWTGIALLGLAQRLYRAAGLGTTRPAAALLVLLAMTGGLQLVTVLFTRIVAGVWMPQVNWVNEMVGGWFLSLIWVPHHIAGFIASWVALLVLAEARLTKSRRAWWTAIAIAGAAFAAAAGLSLWVTVGVVASIVLWSLVLLRDRDWQALIAVALAGAVGLALAAPYLAGLAANRAGDVVPLAVGVRAFVYADLLAALLADMGVTNLRAMLRLLLLPLNYLHEFGLFALGAYLFWRKRRPLTRSDVASLLTLTALAAFLVGTFLRSAISNNDLGWRVMLFAQMPLLLWTAHVLQPFWRAGPLAQFARRLPTTVGVLLAIGLGGLAYDLAMLRFGYAFQVRLPGGDLREPRVDLDLRRAYIWLNRNVPRDAVLQHNPDAERAFGFALYGRNPVGVSDRHSPFLLGASKAAVSHRLGALIPVFRDALSAEAVAETAERHGVRFLLVTAVDPVWQKRPAWLDSPAVFAAPHVRVIDVKQLVQSN